MDQELKRASGSLGWVMAAGAQDGQRLFPASPLSPRCQHQAQLGDQADQPYEVSEQEVTVVALY